MKKILVIIALFAINYNINAQYGKVQEHLKIASKILGKEVNFTIYLPADYETSQRSYPITYLLHGYGDEDSGWTQFGEVNRYADKAIAEGTIPPMIIAMPDGGVSWYMNNFDGSVNYEDFLIKEFLPYIEKNFRTKNEKRYRGIAGLSMGGYGTLNIALKYYDLFAACAPLSAAVFDDNDAINAPQDQWERTFAVLYGKGLKGKDRLNATYYKNSILKMVETSSAENLKKMKYWIDCGDDDFLINGNMTLHKMLKDKGIPHEFRVRDGAHNWTYWRTGIVDALKFIGDSFHQ
jgi:S-formylglutathione hydrolase FrmB